MFFDLVSHLEHVDARVDEELTCRFDSVAYIAADPLASSKSPRAKERGGGTGPVVLSCVLWNSITPPRNNDATVP